jgi:eukaryotic-like serine/threonine-protein kinase
VKFITQMRANKLLAELKSSSGAATLEGRKIVGRLVDLGAEAMPFVIAALATADDEETVGLVEVLATLADARTLPVLLDALADPNGRISAGVAWALSSARNFPSAKLLEALRNPNLPKSLLIDIIATHRERITVRDLLASAYSQDARDKATLFKLIGEIADDSDVPELISRLDGKDITARVSIMELLGRFDVPEVRTALLEQVRHPNKVVRLAALNTLMRLGALPAVETITPLIADPDIEVANRAVDVLIRARHPGTVRMLLPALKHESEYARRAAVEILNELGDANSIKYLLDAIKDSDWWVRSRAADALGKIGGPRVLGAVLELVDDKDEEIRRTAIEILNLTKDERAVERLIAATYDTDWWVSERAVDALGGIGSRKALPRLTEIIEGTTPLVPAAIRAVAQLADSAAVALLIPLLNRTETEVRVEAVLALPRLVDASNAQMVRDRIRAIGQSSEDALLASAATRALQALDKRTNETPTVGAGITGSADANRARTMLDEESREFPAPTPVQRLDITTLQSGDLLDGRYKYLHRIGRGAFGTVVLVEDIVVGEQLVLKFLNSVAPDDDMLRRFTRELRVSRRITHPNVIRIFDFLFIRGNYAISMEYFPSHTLAKELASGTALPIPRALHFGIDIARGMAVAHQIGVVHRDLKPANVLINDDDVLKIVDFGVAAAQKDTESHLTHTGYVVGSPKYMAPEQILGSPIDVRSDIYSTGILLYEMLTGTAPYKSGDHMAIMYQHVQGRAVPPSKVNPEVPNGLSDVVLKAMAVDRAERYQTMDDLKSALERLL